MRVTSAPMLALAAAMALCVPAVFAQRTNGTFVYTGPSTLQRSATPVPSSVILPMTNPVAPMGNPVQPFIQPPFIRYSGSTPTVVVPEQTRGNRGNNRPVNNGPAQRSRGRDAVLVPVAVPSYYPSYYYPPYGYYPLLDQPQATIPGQLPSLAYPVQAPAGFDVSATAPSVVPPASTRAYEPPQPEVYSEPRMIINEPRPNRVIQRPAIGSTRAEVLALLGQPWGSFSVSGQETLYFDGVTVVIAADGRVIQVR